LVFVPLFKLPGFPHRAIKLLATTDAAVFVTGLENAGWIAKKTISIKKNVRRLFIFSKFYASKIKKKNIHHLVLVKKLQGYLKKIAFQFVCLEPIGPVFPL
jgi:hypothetical protein